MTWLDYDQHARTRPRHDLWGQVRRTVHGNPVSSHQIGLIVAGILRHLDLGPQDVLLDLACGNGALSALLQPHCAGSLGVDVSGYLIEIAQERFATDRYGFHAQDATDYVEQEPAPHRFTKALIYGSLSYLDDAALARLFRALHARFTRTDRVWLGNLPDPARAGAFYSPGTPYALDEPRSAIGVWRSLADIGRLAGPGWRVSASTMPPDFYAAHYRFDALLERIP
ncbi:MAG: hypothetical protein NVSMB18_27920 [Acetobacteraceae bacterium]